MMPSSAHTTPSRSNLYPSELRLIVTGKTRFNTLLDHQLVDAPDDPSLDELIEGINTDVDVVWLAGGEPTLRPDFPKLVAALVSKGAAEVGLITDGLALVSPKVCVMLKTLGLRRVRLQLAGARGDAHDWLMGREGVWKRAIRAAKSVIAAGLRLEVECTVTRPTRPYLAESVEFFGRLGAKVVIIRRITGRGPTTEEEVALFPRFGLMQGELEKAVTVGSRLGVRVMIEGFPRCVAPAASTAFRPVDTVRVRTSSKGSWAFLGPSMSPPSSERGCARCPGKPECCEAPLDYVRRHGRMEIDAESNRTFRPATIEPTPLEGGEVFPPGRKGRYPPAKLSYVRAASALDGLMGDPLVAVREVDHFEVLRFLLKAPGVICTPQFIDEGPGCTPETTRQARIRLVQAAQQGVKVLRLVSSGTLAHPEAAALLREATRLEFDTVEVAGEASGLQQFTDMQMRRLRGITRFDIALFGPDAETHDGIVGVEGAFDAALDALDRLANIVPKMKVGSYAILTDATHVEAFAEAWDFGDLPGEPCFRLADQGGSLDDLAEAAKALGDGPAYDALAAVLPVALLPRKGVRRSPVGQPAWGIVDPKLSKPSVVDRYGVFRHRPEAPDETEADLCPGFAVGWISEALPSPTGDDE